MINFIVENITLITLGISLINIAITIIKWYNDRPRLKFCENYNMRTFFVRSSPSAFHYSKSECIVFYYIKIANLSHNPCTINFFQLNVEGYDSTESSKRVAIRDKYQISSEFGIDKRMCLELPLTIPPLRYTEGYVVFPYCKQMYAGDKIDAQIIVNTSKKNYTIYDQIKRSSTN